MSGCTKKRKQNKTKQWIVNSRSTCKCWYFGKRSLQNCSESMHKRSLNRNTDSIRIARATQMHLDEISDKIEREKHRNIKSNHHEKIKIWNELKSIHPVFEPLYAIKENQHKLGGNKSPVSKASTQQNVANCSSDSKREKNSGSCVRETAQTLTKG